MIIAMAASSLVSAPELLSCCELDPDVVVFACAEPNRAPRVERPKMADAPAPRDELLSARFRRWVSLLEKKTENYDKEIVERRSGGPRRT